MKTHLGRLVARLSAASICFLALGVPVEGRSFREHMIPNARNVPGASSKGCIACHVNANPRTSQDNTDRNAFGMAVEELVTEDGEEAFWGPALAGKDADGDGVLNGVEMGDPTGTALQQSFELPLDAPFPYLDPEPGILELEVGDPDQVSNPGLASSVPPGGGEPTATPTNTEAAPDPTATPTNTSIPPTATETPTNTEVPPDPTATPTPTEDAVQPTPTSTTMTLDTNSDQMLDSLDLLTHLKGDLPPAGWFMFSKEWREPVN